VLYRFTGGSDGAFPNGGLTFDASGTLYGTASQGGNSGCPNSGSVGCGVVFTLTPPTTEGGAWTQSVLYTFEGVNDGANPNVSLILTARDRFTVRLRLAMRPAFARPLRVVVPCSN
jgi:hypothetical protein